MISKKDCFLEIRYVQLDDLPKDQVLCGSALHFDNLQKYHSKQAKLFVVVLYAAITDNQPQISEYKKEITGTIDFEKRENYNNCEIIIDRVFVPQNFNKSLAQLGEHLCIQNEPYLELADKLRKHFFVGIMEVHVFVAPVNPDAELQQKFKDCCSKVDQMKCCNLKLDFVKQGWCSVLMSSRYVRGDMHFVWRESFKDARELAQKGFSVIRVKIEATASIDGVPATNNEAQILPKKTYFEFHMVFANGDNTIPNDTEVEAVRSIAKGLEKHWHCCIPLSTNAFGTQKFVNMRTYGIGRELAYPRLEELQKHVESAGFKVPRFIREFGVYDSDVTVDCGWLEPTEPTEIVGFLPPIAIK